MPAPTDISPGNQGVSREDLDKYFETMFQPSLFDDYCPNGLQVEGAPRIARVAFAVSATSHSVKKAVELKVDALFVHHGLFWKFHGPRTLTGVFARRVLPLIENKINLYGYHLPLDGHLEVGNASALAEQLQLSGITPFGLYKKMSTGVYGRFLTPQDPIELRNRLVKILNHEVYYSNPTGLGLGTSKIQSIGIITGGANSQWTESLSLGLDAYLTGEMSEHDYHESRESGIHMYAGGHHATERFGVLAVMNKLRKDFPQLECHYIESDNPA